MIEVVLMVTCLAVMLPSDWVMWSMLSVLLAADQSLPHTQ